MEEEWEELSNLLSQLHKKMEYAANTIRYVRCRFANQSPFFLQTNYPVRLITKLSRLIYRCTNCGNRHKRSMVERPLYAARFCSQCKIHHSAREVSIARDKLGVNISALANGEAGVVLGAWWTDFRCSRGWVSLYLYSVAGVPVTIELFC